MKSDLPELPPGLLFGVAGHAGPTVVGHVGPVGSGMQGIYHLRGSSLVQSGEAAARAGTTSPPSSKRCACSGLVRPVSATQLRKPVAVIQETCQTWHCSAASPGHAPALGGREHNPGGTGGTHSCSPPDSPQNLLGSQLFQQFQALKAEGRLKANDLQERCESMVSKNEELEMHLRKKEEERSEATHQASTLEAECKDLLARLQTKTGQYSGMVVELEERGRCLDAKTSAHSQEEHRAAQYHSELQAVNLQLRKTAEEHSSALAQKEHSFEDLSARLRTKTGECSGLVMELEDRSRRLDAKTSAHLEAEHRATQFYSELQAVEKQAQARERELAQAVKHADSKSEEHLQSLHHMTRLHETAASHGKEQSRLVQAKTDAHTEAERIGREKHTELQDKAEKLRLKEGEHKSAVSLAHERNVQLEALEAQLQCQKEANGATEGQLRLRSEELQTLTTKLWAVEQEHATEKAQADTYSTELQASKWTLQTRTSELDAMERLARRRDTEVQERLVRQAVHLHKVEAKLGETLMQREARIYRAEQEAALYQVESRAYRDELQDASISKDYLENQLRLVKDVMVTEQSLISLGDDASCELWAQQFAELQQQQQQKQLMAEQSLFSLGDDAKYMLIGSQFTDQQEETQATTTHIHQVTCCDFSAQAKDAAGCTALHHASGHEVVIQALLTAGTDGKDVVVTEESLISRGEDAKSVTIAGVAQ